LGSSPATGLDFFDLFCGNMTSINLDY